MLARVDHLARHETEANHTATHLLQAALRERLGSHVRQAGSYVGPDKLRFDFSHGQALSAEELRDVEDRVNEWIARNDPVRAITTTLEEARRLGAMALFGEKYGDVVRMVQVGEGDVLARAVRRHARALAPPRSAPSAILSETSSSANVRRIEAVTGPAARRAAARARPLLGDDRRRAAHPPRGRARGGAARSPRSAGALEKALRQGARAATAGSRHRRRSPAARATSTGRTCSPATVDVADAKALLDVADRVKGRLREAARSLLGTAADGRVHLVASVAPELVERGVKAGEVVKVAAEIVGGGGGGRDTIAQAGGRDPEQLDGGARAGRAAIESALRADAPLARRRSAGAPAPEAERRCGCSRSTTEARAAAAR